jgi:hypothetical protein
MRNRSYRSCCRTAGRFLRYSRRRAVRGPGTGTSITRAAAVEAIDSLHRYFSHVLAVDGKRSITQPRIGPGTLYPR